MWGRAPSPVQAERSSAGLCGAAALACAHSQGRLILVVDGLDLQGRVLDAVALTECGAGRGIPWR